MEGVSVDNRTPGTVGGNGYPALLTQWSDDVNHLTDNGPDVHPIRLLCRGSHVNTKHINDSVQAVDRISTRYAQLHSDPLIDRDARADLRDEHLLCQ